MGAGSSTSEPLASYLSWVSALQAHVSTVITKAISIWLISPWCQILNCSSWFDSKASLHSILLNVFGQSSWVVSSLQMKGMLIGSCYSHRFLPTVLAWTPSRACQRKGLGPAAFGGFLPQGDQRWGWEQSAHLLHPGAGNKPESNTWRYSAPKLARSLLWMHGPICSQMPLCLCSRAKVHSLSVPLSQSLQIYNNFSPIFLLYHSVLPFSSFL